MYQFTPSQLAEVNKVATVAVEGDNSIKNSLGIGMIIAADMLTNGTSGEEALSRAIRAMKS